MSRRDEDFDAFVVSSSGRLLRLAQLLTGDDGRAEDLVQDAYARSYLRWDRIERDDPWAYLRRCIVNGHTDWWRRKPWREQLTGTLPDRAAAADLAERYVEQEALMRALAGLTRRERSVVVLRYFQDLTEAQVAATLGVAVGTVKSAHLRAIRKLQVSPHLLPESSMSREQS